MSLAPASLADPAGSNAVAAAVLWVQGTLLGAVATSVAVICVAAVGLMMLSGRIGFRRAAEVILGCFILFGASSIAAGIEDLASSAAPADPRPGFTPAPYEPPDPPPPAQPERDPYAGASVPGR